MRAARRRKRRLDLADNDLTSEQWTAIQLAWGGCAYCGAAAPTPLQRDCVLPLSRGGRYTLDNIVPACRSCNASKSNEEVTHWLRRTRRDEPAFLLRWLEVAAVLREARGTTRARGVKPIPETRDRAYGVSRAPRRTGRPSTTSEERDMSDQNMAGNSDDGMTNDDEMSGTESGTTGSGTTGTTTTS